MIRRSSTPPLTAALAAIVTLAACSSDGDTGSSAGDDTKTSAPTQESPTEPAPSPTGWTPLPLDGDEGTLPDEGTLAPGRYGLTVAENVVPELPWAVVDTPEGFGHFSAWILAAEDPQGRRAVSYWTVHAVYRDPCESAVVEVDTVEDAAAAFLAQPRSKVSAPTQVTLDGYQGLYLELEVPEGTDFADCPKYHPWDIDASGGLPYWQSSGLERLWILDVEGEVVILNGSEGPDILEPASEQLTDMVESVDFIARD